MKPPPTIDPPTLTVEVPPCLVQRLIVEWQAYILRRPEAERAPQFATMRAAVTAGRQLLDSHRQADPVEGRLPLRLTFEAFHTVNRFCFKHLADAVNHGRESTLSELGALIVPVLSRHERTEERKPRESTE